MENSDVDQEKIEYPNLEGPYMQILMDKFRREFKMSENIDYDDDDDECVVEKKELTLEEKEAIRFAKLMEQPKYKSPPNPIPAVNLKSAMKSKKSLIGKKKGKSFFKPRKVTWADDVYDPTPSSDSHYKPPKNASESSNNKSRKKKNGKKNNGDDQETEEEVKVGKYKGKKKGNEDEDGEYGDGGKFGTRKKKDKKFGNSSKVGKNHFKNKK